MPPPSWISQKPRSAISLPINWKDSLRFDQLLLLKARIVTKDETIPAPVEEPDAHRAKRRVEGE